MSFYGSEPALNHNLTQALNEAFRSINTALGGMYTRSYHRLALRQFVFAYVVREMKDVELPLQGVETGVLAAAADELAKGFWAEYAEDLGWEQVHEGLEEGEDEGLSKWNKELGRCLVAYVVQLLQMPTNAGEEVESCELVLTEVDREAGGDPGGNAGEDDGGDAPEDADRDATNSGPSENASGRKVSKVRSEPENFMSERPSEVPRRSRSLVGKLGAFVGGKEKARRRRRNQKNHQRQRVKKRLEREAEEQGGGVVREGAQTAVVDGRETDV